MPKARVRPRTRRRELQRRWGQKHEPQIGALSEALASMAHSVQALSASPDGVDQIQRARTDVKAFLTAVEDAEALPAAPDPAAHVVFARALSLWRGGAELQLASIHPLSDEDSARAAEQIGQGAEEFARFAQAIPPAVA